MLYCFAFEDVFTIFLIYLRLYIPKEPIICISPGLKSVHI